MNDFLELVIPAVTIGFIFLVIFGFFAFMRYMRYKETIALAERGLLRPEGKRRKRNALQWGIMILTVSGGLSCSLIALAFFTDEGGLAALALLVGIVPASFGLGLILSDRFIRPRLEEREQDENEDVIPPHKQV